MAGRVNAQETFLEEPLHGPLEAGDVVALLNQAHDIARLGPAQSGPGGDVTAQTTGVVIQTTAILGYEARDLQGRIDRSQVDGHADHRRVSIQFESEQTGGAYLAKGPLRTQPPPTPGGMMV